MTTPASAPVIENTNLVLVGGKSASGKSASLLFMPDPEGVLYLNCENKRLPFVSKFQEYKITDPMVILEAFKFAETQARIHTIVIDTITFMMDMYESLYVIPAVNGQKAWGEYFQFWQTLLLNHVAKSTKNVICYAHTSDQMDKANMVMETLVKVKGSLMNKGIESYFSTVINSKKVPLTELDEANTPLLTFSDDDTDLGFKYVFQTRLTKDTVNERIRSPLSMWTKAETYIDNDIKKVIDRLHTYYQ